MGIIQLFVPPTVFKTIHNDSGMSEEQTHKSFVQKYIIEIWPAIFAKAKMEGTCKVNTILNNEKYVFVHY